MGCRITFERDFLLAELIHRETAEETRAFFRAIMRENQFHRRSSILLEFRSSRPFFFADQLELVELMIKLVLDKPSHKIALVGDNDDISGSLKHVESLAQERGYTVRSFRSRMLALLWLMNRRYQRDRRNHEAPEQGGSQRYEEDRRRIERRHYDLDSPQMA